MSCSPTKDPNPGNVPLSFFAGDDTRVFHENGQQLRQESEERGLSFVIPVQDEEETIAELCSRIDAEIGRENSYEIIIIDDGSKDSSWEVISRLAQEHPDHIQGFRFRAHAGKAAALSAGFRAAKGNVIFTLDADLQDDPVEITNFLRKLDEGYDLVSGWKKVRHDPWHKVLPSRIFNRMLSRLSGVSLHDHNCGFKCYRAEVVKGLTLYGELHRMIPALVAMKGYRAAEIIVRHHPRLHGRSKYGFERFIRGLFDMLSIWFLRKFGERPSHFVGITAMIALGMGILLMASGGMIGFSSPAAMVFLVLGAVLAVASLHLWALGFVAEMLNRGGLAQQWELPIQEFTPNFPAKVAEVHRTNGEKVHLELPPDVYPAFTRQQALQNDEVATAAWNYSPPQV